MEAVFLHLLNMSITAGWLVLAVLVLRLVFRRAPKWIHCLLWVLVALRLIFPVSVESVLSLIPSAETVPVDTFLYETPTIHSGVPMVDQTVNPIISNGFAPEPMNSVNPMQVVSIVASYLWVLGMAAMAVYALGTTLRLWWRVRESVTLQDNVRLCDRIATPFILGLFRPRIYLPTTLTESDTQCVLAHERAHLRRRDHWWKPLGFLLLTVYWFNPLLWVGYILLCRDIEAACDEKVIRDMDVEQRKAYSETLLACSAPRHLITACPLAFGETGVKSRIKSVLNYKKPAFWVIIAAVVATVVAAVCLLTNPKTTVEDDLNAFLSQTILEQNHSEHTGDAFATEAHTVFGTEKKDGNTVVYGLVLYEEYLQDEEGNLKVQSGSHVPTVITVEEKDGGYTLVEYWVPRDGELYGPDIRDKYPARYQGQALALNVYYDGHREKTLAAARAHFALEELPDESEYVTYAYVGPPSAQLSLQREGNQATFSPSVLSSWMAFGTYERAENQVIFTAESMKLVFRVDGSNLIFNKGASRCAQEHISFGGSELEDGAQFKRLDSTKQTVPFAAKEIFSVPYIDYDENEPLYKDVPVGGNDLPIFAISSVEELDAFIDEYKSKLDLDRAVGDGLMPMHAMKETYHKEFFDRCDLMAVYYRDGYCTYEPQIASVQLSENNTVLTALVDVYTPTANDCALGAWLMLAEVDKISVKDVTDYYAVRRYTIPKDNYVGNFSHPMPAGNTVAPHERWAFSGSTTANYGAIVESAKWYSDPALEKTSRYLGYFSLDGEVLYYVDIVNGRLFNGEKFADLTEKQASSVEFLICSGSPGKKATATLTGTMLAFNKAEHHVLLKVTEADQKELIGKNIKVYLHYYVGGVSVVGASVTVGYDGWVEDDSVYGLTFVMRNQADELGGPDDTTVYFSGKVVEVKLSDDSNEENAMLLDCYDEDMDDTVWVYLGNLPDLKPQVREEYVVSATPIDWDVTPPCYKAITVTPVSSTPTASTTKPTTTTTIRGSNPTVNHLVRDLYAILAAKVRVQRPADAGSIGGSVAGRVIRSVKELKAAKLDALTLYDSAETLSLAYYDEAYFKHNALVVAYITMSSGSYHVSVDRVSETNNTVRVHYTQTRYSTTATADMAYWCVLLETTAQEVAGVTKVTGIRTEKTVDGLASQPKISLSQARAIVLSHLPKDGTKLYVECDYDNDNSFEDGNTYYRFRVYSYGTQPIEEGVYATFTYAWAYVDVHTGKLYREDAAMNLIPWDKDQSTKPTKPTTTKKTTTKKPTTTTKKTDDAPAESIAGMFTMDRILENMNWFSEEKEESLYKNVPKDENVRYLPVVVMTTQKELEGFIQEYGKEMGFSDDEAPLMRKDYNKAYFEKNVLLAVYYCDGSCSVEPRVVAMERTSDGAGLMALVDVYEPQMQNDALGQWFMLYSVKRSDVEGVTSYTARVRGHVAKNEYVAAFTKGVSDPKNAREQWRYFMDVELSWNMGQMINAFKWTDNQCDCLYFWTFNFNGKNYYLSEDYSILFDGTRYATLSAGDRAFFRKLFVPGDESIWVAPY